MGRWRRWLQSVVCGIALPAALATGPAAAGDEDVPADGSPAGPWQRLEEARAKSLVVARRMRAAEIAAHGAGNLPIDATFYDLRLDLDPVARRVRGAATVRGRIGAAAVANVPLDLDAAMQVDSLRVAGAAAAFTHVTDDLVVDLGRTYAPGEAFVLEVFYGGTPGPASALHFDTHSGQPLLWTLSEPYGARTWWPCQDTPADKADSVHVAVTVPTGLSVVGNGTLTGTDNGASQTTFHWHERHPIAPYLVSIAAHPYVALTTTYTPLAGGSMPVTLWSFSDQVGLAQPFVATTQQVLQFYAGLFGEYPFVDEKYAFAQFPWGGGMENQTATSVCCWSNLLTAHETAHQWFGDAVTCEDFSHVWLNEGFATYSEVLWEGHSRGPAAYDTGMWANRFYGNGTIYVPPADALAFGRIFDVNLSYDKPSWVLHMLRGMLGDPTFFEVLRSYVADSSLAYGTATTEDFRAVAERVSGRDLGNFFQRWIYTPYYPTYLYDWHATADGGWRLDLSLEQIQTQGLYSLPVRVRVTTDAGSEDFVLQDSLAQQSFVLHPLAEPRDVRVDPDHWLLCTREAAVRDPSFQRGLLVVNGAAWTLGSELTSAYTDSVFSGGAGFAFWDEFAAPAGGYPAALPPPLGHGALPAEVLDKYSSVVWVGDSDLDLWNDTSIVSYLRAGGNLLFLGSHGQEFLAPARAGRLGLRWAENPLVTLAAASATYPGFVSMTPLNAQNGCAVFETSFDLPETAVLLTESQSFGVPRGIAAWRHPPGGGSVRPNGGHLACISGRPYRWQHAAMRHNVRTILTQLFGEPPAPTAAPPAAPIVTRLVGAAPNPFNPSVDVRFELARAARVQLRVYTASGRWLRTLADAPRSAGPGVVRWDGRDARGRPAASGVYLVRFTADGIETATKIQLVR